MEGKPKVRIIPATKRAIHLKRVGIYARVSTAGKAQLQSLAAQISGLTRHVSNRNDWLLKDIYMDVGSAKTGADRREFARMLTDCKNHGLDYVITKSLSRFGRDNVEVLKAVVQPHLGQVNISPFWSIRVPQTSHLIITCSSL